MQCVRSYHSTLCRAYATLSKALLERLLESLLQKLSIQEEFICLDTTGFRETQESATTFPEPKEDIASGEKQLMQLELNP